MTPIYLCNESECWLTNKPKPYGITSQYHINKIGILLQIIQIFNQNDVGKKK